MWNARLRILAVALPLLVLCGCAAARSPDHFHSTPAEGIDLTVFNGHAMDISIYLLRGSSAIRLGTVTTLERRTFHLNPALMGSSTMLRLAADPVGSPRRVELRPVQVLEAHTVECSLAHDLKYTTFWVR